MGVSRLAFWNELAGISVVEPALLAAYERIEEQIWREDTDSSPHGAPWHTSFHASSFPGDDPLACGRAAIYGLMNVPAPKPIEPRLRAWFDIGKNHELEWVRRLGLDGRLLSANQTAGDEFQTGFVDREHWLTGSPDVLMLPPFWRRSHVVEIKTTSHEKVLNMREDRRLVPLSHAKYMRQLRTYIGFGHELPFAPWVVVCDRSWAVTNRVEGSDYCPVHRSTRCNTTLIKLLPPNDGTLIYSSREEPLLTASFLATYDPEFMRAGRARLAEWRSCFERGEIPPHPREGERAKWSVTPCDYCVTPETLILTSDLEWVQAGSIEVGQSLIGIDEEIPSGKGKSQAYRGSLIESKTTIKRPCVRVTTDMGEIVCSEEHKFLVQTTRGRRWIEANAIDEGSQIVSFGAPWVVDESYSSGYLAGIFDGEGSVTRGHVSVAQVEGPILDEIMRLLIENDFEFSIDRVSGASGEGGCRRVRINGGMYEQLRFLGSIRPLRLLGKSESIWSGTSTRSNKTRHAMVESVLYVGERDVIAFGTSTRTLITNGFISHNCDFKREVCKPDFTRRVAMINESRLAEFTRTVRPQYDPDATRETVLSTWSRDEEIAA